MKNLKINYLNRTAYKANKQFGNNWNEKPQK